ncbi:MerR family transcriptional regulator [Methylobacillus flagellatus]|uniref:Transcriptional regulator, MerR family n=1 Tax=Methylobacillus flagellatus (strain ATCC 51484 / DSM 6875 / VKM B-1610 / KT) TaxID=265072 RepID=Q1GZS4_METFK|nr:MerR family transcriptional regulator [Methylobacillus flagellatus]ABE50263.1 transcriptional regulator, MerR family [Methylobacillus flagellatus KT]
MPEQAPKVQLPPIPAKRYFTIGEVSELCGVKPHVLRYWEQEFTQLKPVKRRGNRRYYQHHEVLLIRRIRELLYEQGFTISGARNRLDEAGAGGLNRELESSEGLGGNAQSGAATEKGAISGIDLAALRSELREVLNLLGQR